jgi:hypothetical protein
VAHLRAKRISLMRALLFAFGIVAGSCHSVLARADTVQVIGDRSFLAGCARVGEVEGSSLMGIIIENEGWANAVEEMKEKALALGATHLLLHRVERGFTGSRGSGDAYNCPLQPEEPGGKPRRRR